MPRLSDDDVNSVPGALWQPDLDIFRVLLERPAAEGHGDLAELGVLYGRSAVLVGDHLRPGETFTVVDLFGEPVSDGANNEENDSSYPGLTQAVFERNYLLHHDVLPVVVAGLTSVITDHARHGTHRFLHVDASHLFEHVRSDIGTARRLLAPDGVLVLDDFRAEHTPGVAAAAWQAVVTDGLRPFAVSPSKMYATWGDPTGPRDALAAWARRTGHPHEVQRINDLDVLRVRALPEVPHRAKRYVPEVAWPVLAHARTALRRRRRARA